MIQECDHLRELMKAGVCKTYDNLCFPRLPIAKPVETFAFPRASPYKTFRFLSEGSPLANPMAAHFLQGPEKSKKKKKKNRNLAYFPWWAHGPYSPGLGPLLLLFNL